MNRSLTASILIACTAPFADAAVRKVPQQFTTIANAVTAANSGDTILISPNSASGSHGVYTENVNVPNTKVGLKFIGKKNPVWDGTQASQLVVAGPNNDNVVLRGITFRNGVSQVQITGAHAVIENCTSLSALDDNAFTIFGDSAQVNDCVIRDCYDAAIFINGADARVDGNRIANVDEVAITLANCANSVVQNNTVDSAYRAIAVTDGDGVVIANNRLSTLASGAILFSGDSVAVRKNRIRNVTGDPGDNGAHAVAAQTGSDDCVIENNTFERIAGAGVYVDGTHARIAKNAMKDVGQGITVVNGSAVGVAGPTIEKNEIDSVLAIQSHAAIDVVADDLTIDRNRITGVNNFEAGIEVNALELAPGNGEITDNKLSRCQGGGIFIFVDGVAIADNTVTDSGCAFSSSCAFRIGADCHVTGNTAKKISGDGFVIDGHGAGIDGCVASECAGDGFDIDATATNVSLDGCSAKNCRGEGLDVTTGAMNIEVTNCTFKKNRIDFAGNSLLTVNSGNVFDTGGATTAPEVDFP